jgi:hypothetical protein
MPEETTGHGGIPPEALFFLDAVAEPVKQQLGTSVCWRISCAVQGI